MELLLKENKTHGDILFPFALYEMEYQTPATILDCHWHDELEFLLLTQGEGVFQVGTHQYELKEGQALFIHAGEIHSGTSRVAGCKLYSYCFSYCIFKQQSP